jgi:DNA-binding transcriptional MocR family regulator
MLDGPTGRPVTAGRVVPVNLFGRAPGTTGQHALDGLRHAIVNRQLRPGQRVRQEELAESLGVSIAPVREALRVLEQEGQVTYQPRRGYFVTELRIEDLEEIYDLRKVMEERAARRCRPSTTTRCSASPSRRAIASTRPRWGMWPASWRPTGAFTSRCSNRPVRSTRCG